MTSLSDSVPRSDCPSIPALLDRAQAGDADAFGVLCRAHEERLLRQALVLCGNETQAEDLAQDALVAAWRSLRRYNRQCQFFTWLCAILLNLHRKQCRNRRFFRWFVVSKDGDEREPWEQVADPASTPDAEVEQFDDAERMRQCIRNLPPKHQQVIHLRFYVDDSLPGIAAALGCSVGTVKSRLFNALEKLRAMNALREMPARKKF